MTGVPTLTATEATAVAAELAAGFAREAADRDARRALPIAELDRLSRSGLLAITVPLRYGGAELPVETVAEVIRSLSAGDPNIGQIPHSHFVYVNQLRLQGTDAQRKLLFGEVLAGRRFGNAQSEANTRHVREIRTTLTADAPGHWRLNGRKFYATGALLAHRIPVLAHLGPDGPLHVAWVDGSVTVRPAAEPALPTAGQPPHSWPMSVKTVPGWASPEEPPAPDAAARLADMIRRDPSLLGPDDHG